MDEKEENKEEIIENEIIDDDIIEEAGIQEKLKKLREDLKKCHTEKAEYLAGWQRAKADFINARKDEGRLMSEFAKFAGEKVLGEMLAVADSLEMAGKELSPIYAQLIDVLKKNGVAQVSAKHQKFDPMYHEALGEIDTKNKEENGIILEELQKGYIIHNRVLRPSKVKVGIYKQASEAS